VQQSCEVLKVNGVSRTLMARDYKDPMKVVVNESKTDGELGKR